jgi:DNA primase
MSEFEQFIQKVKQSIDLSSYIGNSVNLQSVGLNKYKGCCPFHNEKTPSFTVNDDKQYYHCFGCGAHGDIISYLQEKEGHDFKSAIQLLSEKTGIALPKTQVNVREVNVKDKLYYIHKQTMAYFCKKLHKADKANSYLTNRGFDTQLIQKFAIGFAPKGNLLLKYLLKQGFSEKEILASGLVRRSKEGRLYDLLQDRVTFPIFDIRNRVIAFGGRVIDDSLPKYINSPETNIFKKKQVLFNIDKARQISYDQQQIIVCEGYADVIKLDKYGFENSVAPLGTACGAEHLQQLWKIVQKPHICMDGDQAGLKAIYRLAVEALAIIKPGYSLAVVLLPSGKDPDDVVSGPEGESCFRDLLNSAQDLPDFIYDYNFKSLKDKTPASLAKFESGIFALCEKITDEYVKKHFVGFFKKKFYEMGSWQKSYVRAAPSSMRVPKIQQDSLSDIHKVERDLLVFIFLNQNLLAQDQFQQDVFDLSFTNEKLMKILNLYQNDIEFVQDMSNADYFNWLKPFSNALIGLDVRFKEMFESGSIKLQNNDYNKWQQMQKLYFLTNMRKEYESLVVSNDSALVDRAQKLLEQMMQLQNELNN